jgi:RNA polymerase subunit RPABC4/transcription elongation factor Spt4
MSIEELEEQAQAQAQAEEAPPRTRTCRVCSVEINAASARCPYCGARQFKHQPVLGWRGLLVLVVAVAAAVLITRAIIDAENGKLRYDSYNSVNLAGFVPSGWQNLLLSGPHGTAMAGYVNPAQSTETETITATLGAPGSPHSRMLALYRKLATEPGVARGYHGSVTFVGDDIQWSAYYAFEGAYYGVFFSDACRGAVAMTVKLSSSSPTRLQQLALALPWSAAPHCDGPAFSARDRADSSVPLASR